MRFTKETIQSIADSCNVPTGDEALEGLFLNYDRRGSNREDVPVYYRFLYRLSRKFPGLKMIELGYREGGASLHVLKGGGARSVGVDLGGRHKPELFKGVSFVGFHGASTNPITASMAVDLLGSAPDIVFIDTDHGYESTHIEFELWRNKVKPGGMILFDDIDAPEYGCGKFFREIQGEKLELPSLHPDNWGFGVYFVP